MGLLQPQAFCSLSPREFYLILAFLRIISFSLLYPNITKGFNLVTNVDTELPTKKKKKRSLLHQLYWQITAPSASNTSNFRHLRGTGAPLPAACQCIIGWNTKWLVAVTGVCSWGCKHSGMVVMNVEFGGWSLYLWGSQVPKNAGIWQTKLLVCTKSLLVQAKNVKKFITFLQRLIEK